MQSGCGAKVRSTSSNSRYRKPFPPLFPISSCQISSWLARGCLTECREDLFLLVSIKKRRGGFAIRGRVDDCIPTRDTVTSTVHTVPT